eukprot:TRINITY_DN12643_c0_g1_i10.p1 TRINITY_DN12643_c0_g1~~TRINITY_DN12643_c0_g1_i10.p1  ORF type:complete len:557 (+),score=136.87 TRINITY_DN12643_c0_g1_i10:709-2379(+)
MFARKRRASTAARLEPGVRGRALSAHQSLAGCVLRVAKRTSHCFRELASLQHELTRGLEVFLGLSDGFADENLLVLIQQCAEFVEASKDALSTQGLDSLQLVCEDLLQEYKGLSTKMEAQEQALAEKQHYEGKVAGLQEAGSSDKVLVRNQDKLKVAEETFRGCDQDCHGEFERFESLRDLHVRATIVSYARLSTRALKMLGVAAEPLAAAFASELYDGARVQLFGLQKARDLNGRDGVIETIEPQARRCMVRLGDGELKSVQVDHVHRRPSSSETDSAFHTDISGSVEADEPALDGAAGCSETPVGLEPPAAAVPEALIGFGHCGNNMLLETPAAADNAHEGAAVASRLPTIARRTKGVLHGVVMTESALRCQPMPHRCAFRYYYQIKVLEAVSKGTSRTLSLGFVWPRPGEYSGCSPAAASEVASSIASCPSPLRQRQVVSTRSSLPENARDLGNAIVVGDGVCKLHCGGKEVQKISAWHPLRDVSAGASLGCLLDQCDDVTKLSIYQDGRRVFCVDIPTPYWSMDAPHAVVDVCGAVKSVELEQIVEPPAFLL